MADGTVLIYNVKNAGPGDGTKGSNFVEIQEFFGKRPGDYRIDPYYLRTGMGSKPYFYDARRKKWSAIRRGDKFYFDSDGIPTQEKANG